jgi:hypothetical protein
MFPNVASPNASDQVNKFSRMVLLGALVTILDLAGCHASDHGPYRYERGDRVDRDGHRDVGWCNDHHEDDHCR